MDEASPRKMNGSNEISDKKKEQIKLPPPKDLCEAGKQCRLQFIEEMMKAHYRDETLYDTSLE